MFKPYKKTKGNVDMEIVYRAIIPYLLYISRFSFTYDLKNGDKFTTYVYSLNITPFISISINHGRRHKNHKQ